MKVSKERLLIMICRKKIIELNCTNIGYGVLLLVQFKGTLSILQTMASISLNRD